MSYLCYYNNYLYRSDEGTLSKLIYNNKTTDNDLYAITVLKTDIVIEKRLKLLEIDNYLYLKQDIATFDNNFKVNVEESIILSMDVTQEIEQEQKDILIHLINSYDYLSIEPSGNIVDPYGVIDFKNYNNISELIKFFTIYLDKNKKNICSILNEDFIFKAFNSMKSINDNHINNLLKNLYKISFLDIKDEEIINLLNLDPSIILKNINLEEKSQLPKFLLDYIEENNFTSLKPLFQSLNLENKELKILLNFLENSHGLTIAKTREKNFYTFIEYIINILDIKKYNIEDLLAFLIKESYYRPCNFNYNDYSNHRNFEKNILKGGHFSFPLNEAKYLFKYLELTKNNNIDPQKYPNIMKEYNYLRSTIK